MEALAESAFPKKLKVTVARFDTSAGAVHVKVVPGAAATVWMQRAQM